MRHLLVLLTLLTVSGCVRVSSYERGYLSEPTMQAVVDPLEQRAATQLHKAREATSGGIGSPAGGGCGCTN
jgi:hypothetical protein